MIEKPSSFLPTSPPERTNAWMITFVDLISLLLAFFVLIYSTLQPNQDAWHHISQALASRLHPDTLGLDSSLESHQALNEEVEPVAAHSLAYLQLIIQQKITSYQLEDEMKLSLVGSELILSLPAYLASNDPQEMVPMKQRILSFVSVIADLINNKIAVRTYINPNEEAGFSRLGMDWEEALGRAAIVAQQLIRAGFTEPPAVYVTADTIPVMRSFAMRSATAMTGDVRRIDMVITSDAND